MSRPVAKVSRDEVKRIIKAVRDCGLTIARVTFDGARVDVITGGEGSSPAGRAPSPSTFRTLEEYESWRATIREGDSQGQT